MSLFVIETKELKSVKDGWKVIAKNHVVARNVAEALETVEAVYTESIYSQGHFRIGIYTRM